MQVGLKHQHFFLQLGRKNVSKGLMFFKALDIHNDKDDTLERQCEFSLTKGDITVESEGSLD